MIRASIRKVTSSMVSSARQAITSFLLIFSSALYAYSQANLETKTSTASVSGKVTIKDKGASGVVVGLRLISSSSEQTGRYKAISDVQGNYKIINIPAGHYHVVVVTPVFIPDEAGRGKTIIIGKDETIENVDIALIRGGVITGRVTDLEGRPVIEEEISLYPVDENKWFYLVPRGIATDDRGIYRFFGIPPGKYRVAAGDRDNFSRRLHGTLYKQTFHPGTADISQGTIINVSEGSEATNVDITFGRVQVKYAVQGRIVDGRTGQPVPKVRYGVKQFFTNSTHSVIFGEGTNNQGEFRLPNLSPGKYAVFVSPQPEDGWRADPAHFEVIDQDITGLVLRTTTGASLSGVVVLEGTAHKAIHANLRNVRLHANLLEDSDDDGDHYSSGIAQNGSFGMRGLKAGLLAFSLSNYGRFQIIRVERDGIVYSKGLPVKDSEQISGVRIVLSYGSATVQGVFKIEGGTLPQNAVRSISLRRVGADADSVNFWPHSTQVDARGQFFMDGLVPGTYDVNGAIYIQGTHRPFRTTKQQVVLTDGSVTNVTLTINLEPTPNRP